MSSLHVCLVLLGCYFIVGTYSLGASSIIGIDYGTDTMKVMTLRGNAPEIVLNDQSGRKTDTLIGFDVSGERVFGARAAQLKAKFPHRVISSAHQFLGKRFPDSSIENSRHLFPFSLVDNNGTYAFQIDEDIYTPEEIVAMTIEYATNMAYATTNSRPTDCTIVVPPYITQLERQAYVNAAKIANLNVISLVHEGSGAAVQYLRSRLLGVEDTDQYTIFFNVGAGHTSATLTRFLIQKPEKRVSRKIITNTTAWEEVGGRDFDHKLTEFLLQKAEEQFQRDLSGNGRVMQRLNKAARKAKEVLSANKEAYVHIESLTNDEDFSTKVSRVEFEEMCSDLFERVMAPIHRVFEQASMVDRDIIDVEVIGGGSRVVKINEYLNDIFTAERVGRHMNGDESSLSGAMLYAATSSAGKKSSFIVKDTYNRAVGLTCDAPDFEPYTLIKPESRYNAKKNVNFSANDTSTCHFYYEDKDALSSGIPAEINSYEISGFPDFDLLTLAEDEQPPAVRVRCEIDNRGIIDCTEANLRVSIVVEPEPEPEPEEVEAAEATEGENGEPVEPVESQGTEQAEENENEEENSQEPEPTEATENVEEPALEEEVVSSVKLRQFTLKVAKLANPNELPTSAIRDSRSKLLQLNRDDKRRLERAETKNELESYVYATLDFLENESTRGVSTDEERETFASSLLEAGDWLYDDGEDASLEEYQEKLDSLREIGNRIQLRVVEVENRPTASALFHEWKDQAFASLENIIVERNVGEEELEEYITEIRELESWLETKQEEQAALSPYDDPVWTSSELSSKTQVLDSTLKRLLRRRKRTPTPTPTPVIEIDPEAQEEGDANELPFDFDNVNFGFEEEPIPIEDQTEGAEGSDDAPEGENAEPVHDEL